MKVAIAIVAFWLLVAAPVVALWAGKRLRRNSRQYPEK